MEVIVSVSESDRLRDLLSGPSAPVIAGVAFWTFVSNGPLGQIVVANDGVIVFANHAAHVIFGYPHLGVPGELVGLSIEQLLPPAQREAHVEHRLALAERSTCRPAGSAIGTVDGLRKDGSLIAVHVDLVLEHVLEANVTRAVVRTVDA